MSRPYTLRQHQGFLFDGGHKVSREELKHINAQLAAPTASPKGLESDHDVVAHIAMRPHTRYNRKYVSTILERLQGNPEMLQRIAEIAIKTAIPENWHLNNVPVDGAQELHHDQRIGLLQTLGETGLEESAA